MRDLLKPREKIILEEIITYISTHQYPPTVREIGMEVGLKSTSSVHKYLKDMIKKGIIESDDKFGSPRAIRIPGYRFVKQEQHSMEG